MDNKDFKKWKTRYEMNFATKEQLQRLITLEVITTEEYTEITGETLEN